MPLLLGSTHFLKIKLRNLIFKIEKLHFVLTAQCTLYCADYVTGSWCLKIILTAVKNTHCCTPKNN